MDKQLHSTDSVTFYQNIAYNYNERGWLTNSSAPLFSIQLLYNTAAAGKQYNGNIAYQSWVNPQVSDNYTYTYDKLNRLMSGTAGDSYTENNISYDAMGNIMSLNRYQAGTLIDQLSYSYTNAGNPTNQLQTISDNSGNNTGVKAGTGLAYVYDNNGNVTTDPSRNTGSINIGYNLLNLPQSITGGKTITYTYDATGNKLRRVSTGTGNTDYINGIEYDGGALNFIQTEEGKAVVNGSSYTYYYDLGDNLGNTRVTFTNGGPTQVDDYYPFGMEMNRYTNGTKNEYLYNKKELQEELGQYDYGARFYDPVIGRWITIDPLAEVSRRWSPYNYVENDPIRLTDPDGMLVSYDGGNATYTGQDAVNVGWGLKIAGETSKKAKDEDRAEAAGYPSVDGEQTNSQATSWPAVKDVIGSGENDFVPYDKRNCLTLAKEQIAKVGYKDAGKMIQTYTEKDGVNLANSTTAVNYINSQLRKGIPIIVGVDAFTSTSDVKITKENLKYGDDATDHFIVIVGSGSDTKGDYYHFFDSSTTNRNTGTSVNNKLYYNKTTGLISGNTSTGYASPSTSPTAHPFIVSQVRQSESE